MIALKSKLLRAIKTKKINVFLLFVLLAFIILLLSKLSRDYTNTIIFNVISKNAPEEAVILKDPSHKLKVTFSTYGFKWLKYYIIKPNLEIDFVNDVTKTDSVYIWSTAKGFSTINNQFDKTEKVISINPDTLRFKYDENSVKLVPVIANVTINYSPGFNALEEKITEPDSVKILGPSSLLDKINYLSTKAFNAEDVRVPISETLELDLDSIDKAINVTRKKISFKSNVEKFTEGTLSIPIEIINVPNTITLTHFPKTINVYYFTSLKAFKDIKMSDFKVVCDYNELSNNSAYLTPKLIKKPVSIKRVRMQQQNVEFIITK